MSHVDVTEFLLDSEELELFGDLVDLVVADDHEDGAGKAANEEKE